MTVLAVLPEGCSDSGGVKPISVLLITAHPDDETMFNLGRFRERGWQVSIALVTNGEHGAVVQGIRPHYDPWRDEDILIEELPGPATWLTSPPNGPRIQLIPSAFDLAAQRRSEFLGSIAHHRGSAVYFLSSLEQCDFEDSWDSGVRNWDVPLLTQRLKTVFEQRNPDILITLNDDGPWTHPQHQGLSRIVQTLWMENVFVLPDGSRPKLYGIREIGWYKESAAPQAGDLQFNRLEWSPVLQQTYAEYWREATSYYISQSSHPVWFDARTAAGILPGYKDVDVIRRLDTLSGQEDLEMLFALNSPDADAEGRLPKSPTIVDVTKE